MYLDSGTYKPVMFGILFLMDNNLWYLVSCSQCTKTITTSDVWYLGHSAQRPLQSLMFGILSTVHKDHYNLWCLVFCSQCTKTFTISDVCYLVHSAQGPLREPLLCSSRHQDLYPSATCQPAICPLPWVLSDFQFLNAGNASFETLKASKIVCWCYLFIIWTEDTHVHVHTLKSFLCFL